MHYDCNKYVFGIEPNGFFETNQYVRVFLCLLTVCRRHCVYVLHTQMASLTSTCLATNSLFPGVLLGNLLGNLLDDLLGNLLDDPKWYVNGFGCVMCGYVVRRK